jgi:hypothetical protein
MKTQKPLHPVLVRAAARAAWLGSTATTTRGIVRYLREFQGMGAVFGSGKLVTRQGRQPVRQQLPQADRDARRARDDAKFRGKYLAGLRREEKRLCNPPLHTLADVTAAAENYPDRVQRMIEIARLRGIVTGKTTAKEKTIAALPKVSAGRRVSGFDADFARRCGVSGISMVGKDATISPTRRKSFSRHSPGETEWKHGKPVSYTRATHDNYVRSFGLILSPQELAYAFHETEKVVKLPEGYTWDVDANGLRAVCGADDYHVTAPDLLAKDAETKIVENIRANAEKRALFRAQHAAELAEVEGVTVCLADALRAGNCRAGCEAFATRHHLDPRRHFSAPELLSIANGDASRVRLAITAARLRTDRELAQGFSVLSDHVA